MPSPWKNHTEYIIRFLMNTIILLQRCKTDFNLSFTLMSSFMKPKIPIFSCSERNPSKITHISFGKSNSGDFERNFFEPGRGLSLCFETCFLLTLSRLTAFDFCLLFFLFEFIPEFFESLICGFHNQNKI